MAHVTDAVSPINEIQLIESGGMHFVDLWLDGHEMQRCGPYQTGDMAKDMAERLAEACYSLFHKTMEVRRGRNH